MDNEKKGLSLEDDKINSLQERLKQENKKQFGGVFVDARSSTLSGAVKDEMGDGIVNDPQPEVAAPSSAADIEKEKQAAFSIIKPIQTFERDVAESIRKTDASVASINIAEQKKKAEERSSGTAVQTTERIAFNGVYLLVSIVLIVGTIGVLGILYFIYQSKAPVVSVTEIPLISINNSRSVDVSSFNRDQLVQAISNNLQPEAEGSFTEIKLVEKVAAGGEVGDEARGELRKISAEKFISTIGESAPASLARALGTEWLFGFYSRGGRAEPFVLNSINSFDNTFDGMLQWESKMATDLKSFLEYQRTIGTSTEIFRPNTTGKSFEDVVIRSKNVRVLKDADNEVVLLYSFLSDKYIVVTTSEQSFREILTRFLASNVVR